MTVYVDNMQVRYRRMIMCHCWADTRAELFAMMDCIGVKHKWFQRPDYVGGIGMRAGWEHFDISQTMKKRAIAAGAIEVSMYKMAHDANRQNFIYYANPATFNEFLAFKALKFMILASNSEAMKNAKYL